ncbi:winged helix-turn-helix transcriptional regulator [Amycolatopsis bartoniae]|nr:winged helix-turn-helix transcriptional regulator [Amycolatopsis bartoniae]
MYEQMAAHIEARIRAGELQPNRPLPGERELAEEYRVSLGTARHAVRLLKQRGFVRVIRSKGTYVSPLEAFQMQAEPVGQEEHWSAPDRADDSQRV